MTTPAKNVVVKKRHKIFLSERAPVSIDPAEWPVIAEADCFEGKVAVQANQGWYIRVREHADGRRLIYGKNYRGNGGMPEGWRETEGGFLLKKDRDTQDETVRSIRRVAGIIGRPDLADDCIAELPAVEV